MKMKKVMGTLAVGALAATLAIGGTLAYLTDREAEVNVFTLGDVSIDLTEDFEQGAQLLPGVKIEKMPTIENTGKNDSYVWMTVAIPTALDNFNTGMEGSSENIIHWNCLGATWEGYANADRIAKAVTDGYLPEGTTAENIVTWNVNEKVAPYETEIDGVDYNVYTLLYNEALAPGETTLPGFYQVYMDTAVDIDPEGNMFKVDGGEVTDLEWNVNEDGAPKIYVAAYAMQAEGFADVKAAYEAYGIQWADKGIAKLGGFTFTSGTATLNENITVGEGETDAVTVTGEGTVLTITGGYYDAADKDCAVWAYGGAKVIIEGGHFICDGLDYAATSGDHQDMIYAGSTAGNTGAVIEILGGRFEARNAEGAWLLNESDNRGEIIVKGGTFVNWNPADNVSEGANTSFVAPGYKVVESTDTDDNTLYTVVAE